MKHSHPWVAGPDRVPESLARRDTYLGHTDTITIGSLHFVSEERLPARHAVATGKPLRAESGLPQHLIAELPPKKLHGGETELSERFRRPATRFIRDALRKAPWIHARTIIERELFCWRLRDDQPATLAKEWCCALSYNGRGPERTNDHPVKRSPEERIPSAYFGSQLHNMHPVLKATGDHSALEEICAALIGIQENENHLRPLIGQD